MSTSSGYGENSEIVVQREVRERENERERERERESYTQLTGIPKCSVAPLPVFPRTPKDKLSSRNIGTRYLFLNSTYVAMEIIY